MPPSDESAVCELKNLSSLASLSLFSVSSITPILMLRPKASQNVL